MNFVILREDFSRARANSVDLFNLLVGKIIHKVSIHPSDRILIIQFEDNFQLCAALYNTAGSNIYVINPDLVIEKAFKRERDLIGQTFMVSNQRNHAMEITDDSVALNTRSVGEQTAKEYLRLLAPGLGTIYSREVLFRAGFEETQQMRILTDEQRFTLGNSLRSLLEESSHPSPSLYNIESRGEMFSTLPLHFTGSPPVEVYPSVNEGVIAYLTRYFRTSNFEEKKNKLSETLQRTLRQIERSNRAIQNELRSASRAVEYEHCAHTIMANLDTIAKGIETIKLPDVYDGTHMLTITLDGSLTAYANAERYFEKARKAKASRVESERRLETLRIREETLRTVTSELATCSTPTELKEFLKRHERDIYAITEKEEKNVIPFRVFTVTADYQVWVGKSSANNDLLTMKYAKPNDLWFHVRGVSGSHTVLKVKGGKPTPREAIVQTASIAAYYSKMRNAHTVPVAYCERKYVRKPKHAQKGAVILEREEVLYVEPHLP